MAPPRKQGGRNTHRTPKDTAPPPDPTVNHIIRTLPRRRIGARTCSSTAAIVGGRLRTVSVPLAVAFRSPLHCVNYGKRRDNPRRSTQVPALDQALPTRDSGSFARGRAAALSSDAILRARRLARCARTPPHPTLNCGDLAVCGVAGRRREAALGRCPIASEQVGPYRRRAAAAARHRKRRSRRGEHSCRMPRCEPR